MTSGLSDTRATLERPASGGDGDTAVVLATAADSDGRPAALLPFGGSTVLGRLWAQLEALGVTALVVARPAFREEVETAVGGRGEVRASASPADDLRLVADVARAAHGGVLLAYGDLVTDADALEDLTGGSASSILGGHLDRPLAFRVRAQRNRVVSAASPYHSVHRANASFLGVVRVAPHDLEALAAACERLVGLVTEPSADWLAELEGKAERWRLVAGADDEGAGDDFAGPDYGEDHVEREASGGGGALTADDLDRLRARTGAAPDDVAALALTGLVRAGTDVRPVWLRRRFYARPLTPAGARQAAERIRTYDAEQVRLDSVVKGVDGLFTTFFVSPYSKYVARWAARRGLTPNQVTTASMLIGAAAAAAFATGERWGLIAGAVLLQVSFTTDCVDGQLARYTRRFSALGAWLDSVFDRTKEYLTYAGLAIGAARAGDPLWVLACAAIALQTVRHTSDFGYWSIQEQVVAPPQTPIQEPADHAGATAARRADAAPRRPFAATVLGLWAALDRVGAARWIKRMVAFPIGERFAVISLTAALFTPRTTFVALLSWGALAFVYTQTGRTLRSLR